MMNLELSHAVADLLYREGATLDEQRWDDWLALFTEDVEYWMPAWDSEHALTRDPRSEISLMFYDSRQGLEDRVWRIRSGLSAASHPLPRTVHFVGNIRATESSRDLAEAKANWQVQSFRPTGTQTFYGHYEYTLRRVDGDWKIAKKKIILTNDVIPAILDFYQI